MIIVFTLSMQIHSPKSKISLFFTDTAYQLNLFFLPIIVIDQTSICLWYVGPLQ